MAITYKYLGKKVFIFIFIYRKRITKKMIKTLEEYNHKYGVTDSGDVVLLYRKVCNGTTVFYNPPKKMRKQKNKDGYEFIILQLPNGKKKLEMVHRLVAKMFLCKYEEGLKYVGHRNGNISDNRATNLYWTPIKNLLNG